MKFTVFLTLLTFFGLAVAGSVPKRGTDCNECREHRDLCLKVSRPGLDQLWRALTAVQYGNGDRNSGEPQVCTSFICRKYSVSVFLMSLEYQD